MDQQAAAAVAAVEQAAAAVAAIEQAPPRRAAALAMAMAMAVRLPLQPALHSLHHQNRRSPTRHLGRANLRPPK